jgi:heterodisulfide reductase subunit A-like polyferredoxin
VATLERILIVGGGIAGLTLATALHRQGFTAELVERSPTWQTIGAGIMLHGNGVRRGAFKLLQTCTSASSSLEIAKDMFCPPKRPLLALTRAFVSGILGSINFGW